MDAFRRMELGGMIFLPSLLSFLLVLVYLLPIPIDGFERFMPLLPLLAVYHLAASDGRPLPVWVVFVMGLVIDAFSSAIMGTQVLLYLLFHVGVFSQRHHIHKEGFIIKWGYALLFLGMFQTVHWVMISLLQSRGVPVLYPALQWLFTAGLYPLVYVVFERLRAWVDRRCWYITHEH